MGTAEDALAILGTSVLWSSIAKLAANEIDFSGLEDEAKAADDLLRRAKSRPRKTETFTHKSDGELTPAEIRRNIHKSLQLVKPRTKSEKEVAELAGRRLTPGQVARYMGIGGAVVSGLGVGRRTMVQAGKEGLGRLATREGLSAVAHPSAVAADALYGGAIGALPVIRRKMDIEAARRGQF